MKLSKNVTAVQFGILSPQLIESMSVLEVVSPSLSTHEPGVNNLALGTITTEDRCETCEGGRVDCPGHFGHINLAVPVFHIGYLRTISWILKSVCWSCSRLKQNPLDDADIGLVSARKLCARERFKALYKILSKKQTCNALLGPNQQCGIRQPKIKLDGLELVAEMKGDEEGESFKEVLTPQKVLERLRSIPDEDYKELGFNLEYSRPEWMVLRVLLVPPPQIRPPLGSSGDLTYKLIEILRINTKLQQSPNLPEHIFSEFTKLLQYHINTYLKNNTAGVVTATNLSGYPIASLYERLNGKMGRVRANLMAKRGNFSARSVITGDPNIGLEEVGVPLSIAKSISYPEKVTPFNIQLLRRLVRRGANRYPGALAVVQEGRRIQLKKNKDRRKIELHYGDTVERHLRDGDVVVLNRQPSLHKMSIMGHRIRVLPGASFRINLSVTTPYNADFDGDEMNMFFPQSEMSRAEVLNLMMVPDLIVSPQFNRPIMGLVQDALVGAYLLTKRDSFLECQDVMNLLMWAPHFNGKLPVPAILKPVKLWTGKQLFSIFLPSINFHKFSPRRTSIEAAWNSPTDSEVLIQNGELIYGILDKSCLARNEGGIVHMIWRDYGPQRCANFLSQIQQVVNNWLQDRGVTLGLSDLIMGEDTKNFIASTHVQAQLMLNELTKDLWKGRIERLPSRSIIESFEDRIATCFCDRVSGMVMLEMDRKNNLKVIVECGSKGSAINIKQMMAFVGQQCIEGSRIPLGFRDRALPHYPKDSFLIESRGYVKNSYMKGLRPQEFFFHAMGGREGFIDSSLKTSQTGYLQRRLIKLMEDVMVHYDGTVRKSDGQVIQFVYGDDGLNGTKVEHQNLNFHKLGEKEFAEKFQHNLHHPSFGLQDVCETNYLKELKNVENLVLMKEELTKIRECQAYLKDFNETRWTLPVNLERLLQITQDKFSTKPSSRTDLTLPYIIQKVNHLCTNSIPQILKEHILSEESVLCATKLFCTQLRSVLSSKRILLDYHLKKDSLDYLISEIERHYRQSIVQPGEMVGVIAAQSIGEPSTQMTLNAFNYAGVSSKKITMGIPRLLEILNSLPAKSPSHTIYLKQNDYEFAHDVLILIQKTKLKDLSLRSAICFDPYDQNQPTTIPEDRDLISLLYVFGDDRPPAYSWVLRFVLDRNVVCEKKMYMSKIADRIEELFPRVFVPQFSDDNAEELVLRLGMAHKRGEVIHIEKLHKTLKQLENVHLFGLEGIDHVYMREEWDPARVNREWVLDTDGTNLLGVLGCPQVDGKRTISNDIVEVMEVLGIEAARKALLSELKKVISFDGSYVNHRHLAILGDMMTCKGRLLGMTRFNSNCFSSSPLMRCSFEETAGVLHEAAVYAERDGLLGVSENVILGKVAPFGTGGFEVLGAKMKFEPPGEYPPQGESPEVSSSEESVPPFLPLDPVDIFAPAHPAYGFSTPVRMSTPPYFPSTPTYSPSTPTYSPRYDPLDPTYSPTYSPTSPNYSPTYNPSSPTYSPIPTPTATPRRNSTTLPLPLPPPWETIDWDDQNDGDN